MAQLSDRLNRLAPSATLAMSQKSSEMKAQGIDVIQDIHQYLATQIYAKLLSLN